MRPEHDLCAGSAPLTPRAVNAFFNRSLGTRFETRFIGERLWWPAAADDVARDLGPYYPDLEACLERLAAGEELHTRLSAYRIAPDLACDATRRTADERASPSTSTCPDDPRPRPA